jgi:predicted secreted hydrolase
MTDPLPPPPLLSRRRLLLLGSAVALGPSAAQARVTYPRVVPRPLVFPRDHGAHPDYRTEWWYLTGHLGEHPQRLGIQVTFFRVRPSIDPANPSRFAAHQLIIAHAAIADPARGSLLKDERVARAGFDVAGAAQADTDVRLDRWRFRRESDGRYRCEVPARGFTLRFTATPTQPLLLQGVDGFSQKGPQAGAGELLLHAAAVAPAGRGRARRSGACHDRQGLARPRVVDRGAG